MIHTLKKLYQNYKKLSQAHHDSTTFTPTYRVVNISKNNKSEYLIKIQVINKNMTLTMKPEEILINDQLVNQFSPIDIRTLTYLGYLDMNSPKYTLLAKRLCENDKLIFALQEKGNDKIITTTAEELTNQSKFINRMSPKDANLVGFAVAAESAAAEKRQKEEALQQAQCLSQTDT